MDCLLEKDANAEIYYNDKTHNNIERGTLSSFIRDNTMSMVLVFRYHFMNEVKASDDLIDKEIKDHYGKLKTSFVVQLRNDISEFKQGDRLIFTLNPGTLPYAYEVGLVSSRITESQAEKIKLNIITNITTSHEDARKIVVFQNVHILL
jgi:hypothetical protein